MKKIITAIVVLMCLSACKVRIEVPEGGKVVSESGAISCASGQSCDIDVVDLFFDETFKAVPDSGYAFIQWQKKDRGLCGGSTTACRLYTSGFEGNAALMSFLNNNEIFYLSPQFNGLLASTGCTKFAGNSPFCVEGKAPSCDFSTEKAYQLASGMTYAEVVEIIGCHGELASWTSSGDTWIGIYQWRKTPPLVDLVITFTGKKGLDPTADTVTVY